LNVKWTFNVSSQNRARRPRECSGLA